MSNDRLFRITIEAPIERIWRELTKTDEAQGAVFNAWLHTTVLGPGAPLQMRTGTGKNVIVDGRVLVCDPPRHFAHTHRFTQHDDPVCEVHYELKELGGGQVEVVLRVVGLPAGTATGKSMESGGDFILKHLKLLAEGRGLPFSTRLMYGLMGGLEFMLPKRCRSDHWPLQSGAHPGD
ncbi:SRPBCC domain-containing protein [Pelomonas sp. SE-A7]|uniref:SRPBCC domain-containing protein n=1 Tax=Pelomonas sp. SE-A7 TaxID=3054953 RepID=UPI00259CD3F8|nr:SRPBCC domain-containing protein [Pelomonas sp. SE-A7]MDM4767026.1 SRPBCC domain-containing protein [Pelomonas sp. SE-A7]